MTSLFLWLGTSALLLVLVQGHFREDARQSQYKLSVYDDSASCGISSNVAQMELVCSDFSVGRQFNGSEQLYYYSVETEQFSQKIVLVEGYDEVVENDLKPVNPNDDQNSQASQTSKPQSEPKENIEISQFVISFDLNYDILYGKIGHFRTNCPSTWPSKAYLLENKEKFEGFLLKWNLLRIKYPSDLTTDRYTTLMIRFQFLFELIEETLQRIQDEPLNPSNQEDSNFRSEKFRLINNFNKNYDQAMSKLTHMTDCRLTWPSESYLLETREKFEGFLLKWETMRNEHPSESFISTLYSIFKHNMNSVLGQVKNALQRVQGQDKPLNPSNHNDDQNSQPSQTSKPEVDGKEARRHIIPLVFALIPDHAQTMKKFNSMTKCPLTWPSIDKLQEILKRYENYSRRWADLRNKYSFEITTERFNSQQIKIDEVLRRCKEALNRHGINPSDYNINNNVVPSPPKPEVSKELKVSMFVLKLTASYTKALKKFDGINSCRCSWPSESYLLEMRTKFQAYLRELDQMILSVSPSEYSDQRKKIDEVLKRIEETLQRVNPAVYQPSNPVPPGPQVPITQNQKDKVISKLENLINEMKVQKNFG